MRPFYIGNYMILKTHITMVTIGNVLNPGLSTLTVYFSGDEAVTLTVTQETIESFKEWLEGN